MKSNKKDQEIMFKYDKLKIISDNRGVVFEPITKNDLAFQENLHVVISEPGIVRGNHYHRVGKETLIVMGPALIRFRQEGKINDVDIPKGKVFRFVFPPGIAHAIQNLSNQPNILLAFNTVEHDPNHPDTVKDVLI
jgi:UDP-2-acetamido-2,6-beta-L-arabino-hexul-4-ose reductase